MERRRVFLNCDCSAGAAGRGDVYRALVALSRFVPLRAASLIRLAFLQSRGEGHRVRTAGRAPGGSWVCADTGQLAQ